MPAQNNGVLFFLYQCNPRTIYRELRHPIHPANTWSIGAIHRTSTPAALVTRICADLACLTEEVKQIPSNYGVSASVAENDSNPQTDTTHTPLQETPRRTTPATLAANRFRVRCTDTRSHIFFLFFLPKGISRLSSTEHHAMRITRSTATYTVHHAERTMVRCGTTGVWCAREKREEVEMESLFLWWQSCVHG